MCICLKFIDEKQEEEKRPKEKYERITLIDKKKMYLMNSFRHEIWNYNNYWAMLIYLV